VLTPSGQHPAHKRIAKANAISQILCGWCGHDRAAADSPHHKLCCRDQYPPHCAACKPAGLMAGPVEVVR